MKTVKRILYRYLPLSAYLRVLSCGFFAVFRLGLGRRAFEYVYFLRRLVRRGDVALDLGANLGYYSRELSRLVGDGGAVHAVEPFPPVRQVLLRNVRRRLNVGVLPYALGERDGVVAMVNDCEDGYMGSGRNRVVALRQAQDSALRQAQEPVGEPVEPLAFEVEMRRGSEVFGGLERIDFVKCDVEGYELTILTEMRPVLERFHPVCLVESGGANRRKVIELFRGLGYAGYVLERGKLVSVMEAKGEKDIIFKLVTRNL